MAEKFVKIPVEIEASRVPDTGDAIAWGELAGWFYFNNFRDWSVADSGQCMYISTLEGLMRADIGDWIIKGVNGEFYPCKPDIFVKSYRKAQITDK